MCLHPELTGSDWYYAPVQNHFRGGQGTSHVNTNVPEGSHMQSGLLQIWRQGNCQLTPLACITTLHTALQIS
jgi:hypothetical protein